MSNNRQLYNELLELRGHANSILGGRRPQSLNFALEVEQLCDKVKLVLDPCPKGFIKVTVSASGDQEIYPLNTIAIFKDQGIVLDTGKVYQVKESLAELEQKIKEAS